MCGRSHQRLRLADLVVDDVSMATAPSVLVFDVNETLIDIDSMTPLFARIFGDARALREWFAQLVVYSMTATLAGRYTDFFTLGQAVLQMLADVHDVDITDDDLRSVKHGMLTMPAYPDVEEGLTALRDNGFRLVTLTNSPPSSDGPTALEHTGLAHFFEQRFSVEACRAFKPAQAVYRHVSEELGVEPAECMMVAAHVWDTIGAQSAGFSGALITRPGNAPLPSPDLPQPDIVAADLRELAAHLTNWAVETSTE
jgi:2-haloacid dehalogenase